MDTISDGSVIVSSVTEISGRMIQKICVPQMVAGFLLAGSYFLWKSTTVDLVKIKINMAKHSCA